MAAGGRWTWYVCVMFVLYRRARVPPAHVITCVSEAGQCSFVGIALALQAPSTRDHSLSDGSVYG
jgi:hypothetical protein